MSTHAHMCGAETAVGRGNYVYGFAAKILSLRTYFQFQFKKQLSAFKYCRATNK